MYSSAGYKMSQQPALAKFGFTKSIDRRGFQRDIKEARGSFFGLRVEVLKLQSRIQDKLRSPLYYIIISTYDQN